MNNIDLNRQAPKSMDFYEFCQVLWRWRKQLTLFVGSIVVLTAIVSLVATKTYLSQSVIRPSQRAGSGSLSSLLSSAASNIPIFGNLAGTSGSNERIISILNSKSIAEEVIRKLDLVPFLLPQFWDAKQGRYTIAEALAMEETVNFLQFSTVEIVADQRLGSINIQAETPSAEKSAAIVAAYVESLGAFLKNSSFSEAGKNRKFIEEQIQRNQQELVQAETDFLLFQERTNLVDLGAQTSLSLEYITDLESNIKNKQLRADYLKRYSSPNNPEVRGIENEIKILSAQLQRLTETTTPELPKGSKAAKPDPFSNTLKPIHKLTNLGQEYSRLKRTLLTLEKVSELLASQHELAKISENESEDSFEVIDAAKVPQKRFKPQRTKNVAIAGFLSSLIGVMLVFLFESLLPKRLLVKLGLPQAA